MKSTVQIAQSIQALADELSRLAGLVASEYTEEAETVTSEQPSGFDVHPVPPEVTLADVRAVLAEKSREGFTAEVRSLLQKHGADKLSAVDPASYEALLKDAEELGNG